MEVLEFCQPSQVTKTTQFNLSVLSYTVGDVAPVSSVFDAIWTTEPAACNIHYVLSIKTSPIAEVDPTLFQFDDK